MNFQSLKFKIPSFFAIYLAVIIFVSIFLIVGHVQENSLEEKLSKNMVMAELMSKKIDTYLDSAMDDVVTSARYISQRELTEDNIYYEIERLFDNYSYFDLVFYMSDQGRMVYSKPYNEVAIKEKTYTDRDYYQYIMENQEPFTSRLYMSRVLDQPHFVLAAPVTSNGRLVGLVAAGIPLKEMKDEIGKTESTFSGGIWVVDSYGSIIVNPYTELMDNEITSMEHVLIEVDGQKTDMYDFLTEGKDGTGIVTREGKSFYVAATFVEGANLAVLLEQEEDVLYSEAYGVVNDMKFIALIIIAVGFVLGFILSRGITNPLNGLVDSVRKWSSGEGMSIKTDRKDEIGELASTFKEMAVNLDRKVEELNNSVIREKETRRYLDNILMSAGSGIIVVDHTDRITMFNRAAQVISGYQDNEVLNKDYHVFSKMIQCDIESIIEGLTKGGIEIMQKEVSLLSDYGRSIPCRIVCSRVRNEGNEKIGYILLISDLEVIKKMEEELKREDRLSIIGEFSSSIIHDIGNPLAGLNNLLDLYRSEMTDQEEKEEILGLIGDEIEELNEIVLSFLSFIRDSESKDLDIDVNHLVQEAVNIMRAEMINRDIKVRFLSDSDLIYANIDRRNFKQAIINILKNAIQAIGENGHIDIDIFDGEMETRIRIKDDGIGMKEDELDKIFEPFYTTKKDGTGLGLSSAYKTVRDNNCKIEVSSEYGEGTEFVIAIPKEEE
jgi:PAS domain S-box-containing protein